MQIRIKSAAAAANAALYVAILLFLLQRLLFVIVCRMAKIVAGSFIESDSRVFFLSIQTRFNFNEPVGNAVALTASIFLCYIPGRNYGHSRSCGGRQPAAAYSTRYFSFFFLKLSINNRIVGLLHKNHIINEISNKHVQRTCLMYHAACKVEFQPFNRSYSQLTFLNFS